MSSEGIFDFDIERIENEKLKDIVLIASSITPANYGRLAEILKNSSQLERIAVNVTDGHDEFWNNFFKTLMPEEGNFSVDPSKIELFGEPENFNCDIYKYIENIQINTESIGKIAEIEKKFPNLKNIRLTKTAIREQDIGDNVTNLFNAAKYMKYVNLAESLDYRGTKAFLIVKDLDEKFIISDDGLCFVNVERLGDKTEKPAQLRINVNDIERIGLEKFTSCEDKITLVINNASELSNSTLQKYQEAGLNIEGIAIYSGENNRDQNETYDVQTYAEIRNKLDELVEGIDLNSPEKERFAEVYKRVCSNIVYDTPAAYPVTKAQKAYAEREDSNCRNLKNGLLEGKCVCAGYADILRNALSMVDIEAKYITGAVVDKKISEKEFKEEDYKEDYFYKNEDGTVEVGEYHAWNKVKLDGEWYNVDPTWDATRIRLGQSPTNCLKTDEEIKRKDKKIRFYGPECSTTVDSTEIDKLFDTNHLYVGKFKVPNVRDVIAGIRQVGEAYVDIGKQVIDMAIVMQEKISDIFKKDKPLALNSPNAKSKDKTSKANSWDLNNWGIDTSDFRKETQNISRNIDESNQAQKDNTEYEKE